MVFGTTRMSNLGHAGPQPTETTTTVFMASSLSAVVSVILTVVERITVAMHTG